MHALVHENLLRTNSLVGIYVKFAHADSPVAVVFSLAFGFVIVYDIGLTVVVKEE